MAHQPAKFSFLITSGCVPFAFACSSAGFPSERWTSLTDARSSPAADLSSWAASCSSRSGPFSFLPASLFLSASVLSSSHFALRWSFAVARLAPASRGVVCQLMQTVGDSFGRIVTRARATARARQTRSGTIHFRRRSTLRLIASMVGSSSGGITPAARK